MPVDHNNHNGATNMSLSTCRVLDVCVIKSQKHLKHMNYDRRQITEHKNHIPARTINVKNCKPLWISILSMVLVNFIVIWLLVLWPVMEAKRERKISFLLSARLVFRSWDDKYKCFARGINDILRALHSTGHSQHLMVFRVSFPAIFFNKELSSSAAKTTKSSSTLKYQWKSSGIIEYTHFILFSIFRLKSFGYKMEFFFAPIIHLLNIFRIQLWVFFFLRLCSQFSILFYQHKNYMILVFFFYFIDILIRYSHGELFCPPLSFMWQPIFALKI